MPEVKTEPRIVLLTDLAAEIEALTGKPCPKTYSQLWKMIVDGRLPSTKVRGKHMVDVRVAAKTAGLTAA
jgi:hypothetical protein